MPDPTVHHAGLTVSDLARAVEFYTGTFGLTVVDEFSVGGDAFADAVDVAGASASFAHLAGGGMPASVDAPADDTSADDTAAANDGARLELVEYDPPGDRTGDTALNRPGAAHVALAVDDVKALHASLDPDVETLSPPRTTESGTTILFVADPDGHLVEVLEA